MVKCSASKSTCETLSSSASSIVASSRTSIFVISLAFALDSSWPSFAVSTYTTSILSAIWDCSSIGWPENVTWTLLPWFQTSLSRSFPSSHRLISYANVNTTSLFSPASFASSSILLFTSLRTSVDTISAVASTPAGRIPSAALMWIVTPSSISMEVSNAGCSPVSAITTSMLCSSVTPYTVYHAVWEPSSLSVIVSAVSSSPFASTDSTA